MLLKLFTDGYDKKRVILLAFSLLLVSLLLLMRYSNSSNNIKVIKVNEINYLLMPSKENITIAPSELNKFITYEFKNILIKFPQEFTPEREFRNMKIFVDRNKQNTVVLSVREMAPVPDNLQNRYKEYFEFFRDVIYSNDRDLREYRTTVIPFIESDGKIQEIQINSLKGFLFTGKREKSIYFQYDLFLKKTKVILRFYIKNKDIDEHLVKLIIGSTEERL